MPELLHENLIQCYGSVDEQQLAGSQKLTGESSTYLRYGTPIHTEVEAQVAELTGSKASETLIFNSGMSAVKAAIAAGFSNAEQQPRIAYASELYAGSTRWLQKESKDRGFKTETFDSADIEDIAYVVNNFKPDVILTETVANYVRMPVLDHRGLLGFLRNSDHQPLVIFDNTLPLSSTCDVYEATSPDDNACIVESGTKAYTFNEEIFGVGYSKNPAVVRALRAQRNDGDLPGIGSARYISELLPNKEDFDERNVTIFQKTGELALQLHALAEQSEGEFKVHHPAVSSNPNYGQTHVPNYGYNSPVLFIEHARPGQETQDFIRRIGDDPIVDLHVQRSDSFGFDRAALFTSGEANFLRLAPGYHTDVNALGSALTDAINK